MPQTRNPTSQTFLALVVKRLQKKLKLYTLYKLGSNENSKDVDSCTCEQERIGRIVRIDPTSKKYYR